MIALVVLNYNDAETTKKFVSVVQEYQSIEHIVIVDNCSTDSSFEQLSILKNDKTALIRTDINKGYANGNNFGIRYSIERWKPEYMIISNPDVRFDEAIVSKMEKVLKGQDDAVAVTCRMDCRSGISLPIAWRLPDYNDCIMENLIILKKLLRHTTEYPESYLADGYVEVEVIPGSFFMLNSAKFLDIGGFDEKTFLYYEENILGWRIKKKGYKQYLITKEEYAHDHSVSIDRTFKSVKSRLRLSFQGRDYYCTTYLRVGKLKRALLRVTFEIGTFDYCLLRKFIKRN